MTSMRRVYRTWENAAPHPLVARDVAAMLRAGSLALLPTETVYGLGVAVSAVEAAAQGDMPGPESGYRRIFSLKCRELTQTVPWLVSGPEALDEYGESVAPEIRALTSAFWPGALTVVVPASHRVPAFMRAGDGTVALRASASPVIRAIIRSCGCPLAVTSANTHGAPAPASFDDVERRVLAGVDVAVDAGATRCRDASTIVAVRDGEVSILREGALSADQILSVISGMTQISERGC